MLPHQSGSSPAGSHKEGMYQPCEATNICLSFLIKLQDFPCADFFGKINELLLRLLPLCQSKCVRTTADVLLRMASSDKIWLHVAEVIIFLEIIVASMAYLNEKATRHSTLQREN